jgi:hypothetical protein
MLVGSILVLIGCVAVLSDAPVFGAGSAVVGLVLMFWWKNVWSFLAVLALLSIGFAAYLSVHGTHKDLRTKMPSGSPMSVPVSPRGVENPPPGAAKRHKSAAEAKVAARCLSKRRALERALIPDARGYFDATKAQHAYDDCLLRADRDASRPR